MLGGKCALPLKILRSKALFHVDLEAWLTRITAVRPSGGAFLIRFFDMSFRKSHNNNAFCWLVLTTMAVLLGSGSATLHRAAELSQGLSPAQQCDCFYHQLAVRQSAAPLAIRTVESDHDESHTHFDGGSHAGCDCESHSQCDPTAALVANLIDDIDHLNGLHGSLFNRGQFDDGTQVQTLSRCSICELFASVAWQIADPTQLVEPLVEPVGESLSQRPVLADRSPALARGPPTPVLA